MKVIKTTNAPGAVGPYSQAIEIDNLVFASGQIALDPATGEMAEGIEAQAHQALKNAQAVINASGAKWENVIKTTVFITNIDDFAKVNEIYATYFTQPYPARSCVEVSKLPKGALIEIEVIAKKISFNLKIGMIQKYHSYFYAKLYSFINLASNALQALSTSS